MECTEKILLSRIYELIVLEFDFEKNGIFNKISFLHGASTDINGEELLPSSL